MKVRAAVLREMGRPRPYEQTTPLAIEEVELEGPGLGEVLVQIAAAGLCHSNLSVIDGSRPRPMPMVLERMRTGGVFKRWDEYDVTYLRADVERGSDGLVQHRIPRWVPERELAAESTYPTRSFYDRVTCPTLVLRAASPLVREGDQVLGATDAAEMASRIADARLVEVEGADHFSIVLGKPPRTLELIQAFLEG